jgi:peptidoglycan/LPS O-acetylase OafA/YrhL
MSKVLEAIGFALIVGMIYAMFGGGASGPMWSLFWPCAVGTLAIVMYRAKKKKSNKKNI